MQRIRLLAILLVLYAVMALVFPGYLEESLRPQTMEPYYPSPH